MRGTILCLFLFLWLCSIAQSDDLRVADGDTFYHPTYGRVRLYGIDTPEKGQPKYDEAKQALREKLRSGKVAVNPVARDKYGRIVGKVTVDGRDIAKELKREGYAKPGGKQRKQRR